jgi:hypothetical protein
MSHLKLGTLLAVIALISVQVPAAAQQAPFIRVAATSMNPRVNCVNRALQALRNLKSSNSNVGEPTLISGNQTSGQSYVTNGVTATTYGSAYPTRISVYCGGEARVGGQILVYIITASYNDGNAGYWRDRLLPILQQSIAQPY